MAGKRVFCLGDHVEFNRASGGIIQGELTGGWVEDGEVLFQITDDEGIDHVGIPASKLELAKAWDA